MWGRCAYLALAGVVVVTALAAAGCGGNDSAPVVTVQGASGASGAGGAAPLTKPAFIKQADAICDQANSALSSLTSATVDAKVQATQELQITRSELDSLQSLTPPHQDSSTLDSFLSALQDEVTALIQERDAAEQGGDTSSADAEAATARSSAQSAARDYGLEVCAKGGGSSTGTGGATITPTAPTTVTPTTTPTTVTPATPPPAPAPPSGGTAGTGTGGGTAGGGTGGSTGGTGGVSP
jgi:hypothetical protein